MVLLSKTKLNNVEIYTSKSFIDSNTSDDEFVSIYNLLNEYNKMKEKIKNPRNMK